MEDPRFRKRGTNLRVLGKHIITVRNSSYGKVMSLHLSVILFTGGVHPPTPRQTPPRQTPPWADTPPQWTPALGRHPLVRQPPPNHPDGHCSRRYTSFWNAFLFDQIFAQNLHENEINWTERGSASIGSALDPPMGTALHDISD